MKERPIIMDGRSVRAILDGRKSQTRRVVQPQPDWLAEVTHARVGVPDFVWPIGSLGQQCGRPITNLPYGSVGERLWVRETWMHTFEGENADACHYIADAGTSRWLQARTENEARTNWKGRWRPPLHMPRWASRLLLEITEIRVERLQAVSHADCIREGCGGDSQDIADELAMAEATGDGDDRLIEQFAATWDETNAKHGLGWKTNPWVWVIGFRVLEPVAEGGAA